MKVLDNASLILYHTLGDFMKNIDDIIDMTLLFDFYGELLSEHQKRIYTEVVFNDYSISEVAQDEGISRQSVSDMIRRINKSLLGYEKKLRLVEKFKQTREWVKDIKALTEDFEKSKNPNLIKEIEEISLKILHL